ncbi:MAG: hypothetical protein RMJ98_21415 [Myxococcales bacterium]|nr:hypothetical protein [Polyangiaceae bacterium]MDW8251864.1 hypothetical protein [Myxococcales bacterium]
MRFLLAATFTLILPSCAAPSRAQRVQEAAYELNVGLRFGHTALALEKVAAQERAEFLKRHRHWHGRLRVVDVELVGLNVRDNEADIFVAIQWQRANYSDVNSSIIHQRWKDHRGTWQLVSETYAQGDQGIFSDESPQPPADTRAPRYQITVIR